MTVVPRQFHYRVAMAVTIVVLVAALGFIASRLRGAVQRMDAVSTCDESNQSQTLSPDRRYIATVFVRDCGSRSGYVTHVNLRKVTDVFMADRNGVIDTGEVVSTNGIAVAAITWPHDTEVEVRLRGVGALQVSARSSWNGIAVQAVDAGGSSPAESQARR